MKIHPQTIYNNSNPEFIVLPIKEYKKLISLLEDFEDIKEIKDYLDSQEETFPIDVVTDLSNGENPIKIYRNYRKTSQTSLAKKVGVSKQYISQLENNERSGSSKVLKSIASALNIDIDEII
tara:strand:+ start:1883 stop:2248 length:366 start_codon:yes stop_codon:yes gene_type:complete